MTDAAKLKRMIHVGCRDLGLDSDVRHDLQLAATGKASLTDMTEAELKAVLDALKKRGFKAGFKGASKGRHAPAPRADLRFIHAMWTLLGNAEAVRQPGRAGLNAFVRSAFEGKWQSVPIDIDALRDPGQIDDVVQALKAMCRRAGIPVSKGQDQ